MKLRSLAIGILFAGILSVPAFSQNAAEPPAQGKHRHGGKGDATDMAARSQARIDQQMAQLTKELTLSQEQQDRIRKLISDNQEQMGQQMRTRMTMTAENRDKMKDLTKQIEDARAAGDKEKVNTLEAQRRELMGESQMTAARQKLMTDIEAALTAEQKTKFQQIKDDVFGRRMSLEEHPDLLMKAVESLKLQADKEQKIKGIIDEWTTKYQNQRSKDRTAPRDRTAPKDRTAETKDRTAAKAEAAEVYKKVMAELTSEEQAAVKAWRPDPGFMGGHEHREGKGADQGAGKGHRSHKHGGGQDANAPAAQPNQ